jgi:hypothetical protein
LIRGQATMNDLVVPAPPHYSIFVNGTVIGAQCRPVQ